LQDYKIIQRLSKISWSGKYLFFWDAMGTIICSDSRMTETLNEFRSLSGLLNVMLEEILKGGDLTIHLQTGHSYYEKRNIVLGVDKLPLLYDLLSTLIMEVCNAWVDVRYQMPAPQAFATSAAYGDAVEKEEWRAVKKHIKIHKELLATRWNVLGESRFAKCFTDASIGWDNFDNYLAYQRGQGHTAQIEKGWIPGK
jgi:hypothetical protein